ncbi:bifunctional UDP-sugar hydrolase/5'-nucleotidase [Nocardioides sp. zg-1228]|uniref:bifunctional metallophosphatase/5'-nucleotidase n=1 Tax=Nocardioides sp. zg-1228 TaxID=2763008 RepID=UPI0016427D7D|nr:bifunctional UDP-sugar hydrolase/5'-nucleotidase [Nocardioides sp. zg-1228]MBC2934341.1 bifunctional metallophosphatase/5'-nucleotidase [Nocardioides sp. zg-1228]QSF59118.1 bifunctional metallophosphatase/5'-nucleotidase [Nocardioides sp. zg-1228]
MPASRTGRRFALATSLTALLAAPLAVVATAAPANAVPTDVQILATNDFHGRLLANGAEAGAAQFAGAVAQLEADHSGPTVFAAGGDLIGASTFDSFIQKDKPTLDALNAAGLDVSAAGNHEFDGGYADLVNRVMAPFDATGNPYGGATWQYIAANVRKKSDSSYALPDITARTPDPADASDGGTWTTTVGGVKVGFIGGVTEELSSLVSPTGIADVKVSSIIAETNAAADALKADGADLVILLVHEGAPTTKLADAQSNDNAFGRIVNGVDNDVSAIISGHTHLAYNHTINGRPVVSAGQYGTNLNKLVFSVDPDTDAVSVVSQEVVAAGTLALTAQAAIDLKAEVKQTVDAAVARGNVLGAAELGSVAGAFDRARLASGTENRGGESTLSNLVAEVQRWATSTPEAGAAQIAFMNPGGLRDDMRGVAGGFPAKLTYKQAANVQSFANTLVNMKMTGAQIKTLLEQQWQTNPGGPVPTRPFLRLGVSKGFFATYDPTRAEGDRVTGMWLDGKLIEPATQYSVTANSFLAGGGDNFRAFNQATAKRDTGKVDLQAMVDYMAQFAAKAPLAVNTNQQHVNVTWPAGAPRFYRLGQKVELALSSLAMTGPTDPKDAKLDVKVGDKGLDAQAVNNTLGTAVYDDYGTAAVSVKLKGKVRTGKQLITFTGPTTGTTFSLPIDVRKAKAALKVRTKPGRIVRGETRTRLKIKTSALGIAGVTGKVVVKVGGKKYTVKLKKGKAFVRLDRFAKAGKKKIVVSYAGSRKVRGAREVITVKVRRS